MKKLTLATAILMSFSCLAANTATQYSFDNSAVVQLDGAQSTTVVIKQVTAGTEGKNKATVLYDGLDEKVGGGANIYQNGDGNNAMFKVRGHGDGNTADVDQVGKDNIASFEAKGFADGNSAYIDQTGDDNEAYVDVTYHGDRNETRINTTGEDNFAKVEYKGMDSDGNYVQVIQGDSTSDKDNRVSVSFDDSLNNDIRLSQTQSNAAIYITLDNSKGNEFVVSQNHRDYTRITGDGAKWNTVRVIQD